MSAYYVAFAHHIRLLLEMPRAKYGVCVCDSHTQFNQYWCGRCLWCDAMHVFREWQSFRWMANDANTVLNQNQKGVACNIRCTHSKWEKIRTYFELMEFPIIPLKLYPFTACKMIRTNHQPIHTEALSVVASHLSLQNFTSQNPFDRSTHTRLGTKPNAKHAHCSYSAFIKSNHRLVVCREQRDFMCLCRINAYVWRFL